MRAGRRSGAASGSDAAVAADPGASAEVDPELGGDAGEAVRVALADGAELPFGAVAVDLAEDHPGLDRGVLGEVVASDLRVVGGVDDADEGVADLAEGLRARLGLVDRDREHELVDVRRHARELDVDLLVVALALPGEVVAGVHDRAVGGPRLVVEDEVGPAANL